LELRGGTRMRGTILIVTRDLDSHKSRTIHEVWKYLGGEELFQEGGGGGMKLIYCSTTEIMGKNQKKRGGRGWGVNTTTTIGPIFLCIIQLAPILFVIIILKYKTCGGEKKERNKGGEDGIEKSFTQRKVFEVNRPGPMSWVGTADRR